MLSFCQYQSIRKIITFDLPEDLEDFVNLRVTGEERLACAHFGENSTHRPHINASRVLASTQENLGGTVPQCHNLVID